MLALSSGWLGLSCLIALLRPALLLWARSLWRTLALTLGQVLAFFALGSDSVAGRPLLRGAATLNGSSVPHGHETVSGAGHFCGAHDKRLSGPYFALGRVLGLDFGAYASARVSNPGPFLESRPPFYVGRALSLCSRLT